MALRSLMLAAARAEEGAVKRQSSRRKSSLLEEYEEEEEGGPQILLTHSNKDVSVEQAMARTRAMYSCDSSGNLLEAPEMSRSGRYQPIDQDAAALQFITMDELLNIQDMSGQMHASATHVDTQSKHRAIFKQLRRQSSVKMIRRAGASQDQTDPDREYVPTPTERFDDEFFDSVVADDERSSSDEDSYEDDDIDVPRRPPTPTTVKVEPSEIDSRTPMQRFKEELHADDTPNLDSDEEVIDKGTEAPDVSEKEKTGWPGKALIMKALDWLKKKEPQKPKTEEEEEQEMENRLPLFLEMDSGEDDQLRLSPEYSGKRKSISDLLVPCRHSSPGQQQEQRKKKILKEIKEEIDFELPVSLRLHILETAIPIIEGTIKEYISVLGHHHLMTEQAVERLAELKAERALYT